VGAGEGAVERERPTTLFSPPPLTNSVGLRAGLRGIGGEDGSFRGRAGDEATAREEEEDPLLARRRLPGIRDARDARETREVRSTPQQSGHNHHIHSHEPQGEAAAATPGKAAAGALRRRMQAIAADLARMTTPQAATDPEAARVGPFQASLLQRYRFLRPQLLDLMPAVERERSPDTLAAYDALFHAYGRIKQQLDRLGLRPQADS
jgi:hypothetical protein